jgi:hypothetical protein
MVRTETPCAPAISLPPASGGAAGLCATLMPSAAQVERPSKAS